MRRKDREISDISEIESIISSCDVVRIGLVDGLFPYVIPMNFGYKDKVIYLHCANEGKKLDIIKINNNVCCEFDTSHKLIDGGDTACEWSMCFASVIGFGKAYIVTDIADKKNGLDIMMSQYAKSNVTFKSYDYPDAMLHMTTVVKIELESLKGKRKS